MQYYTRKMMRVRSHLKQANPESEARTNDWEECERDNWRQLGSLEIMFKL
jgi:hypothetical protein